METEEVGKERMKRDVKDDTEKKEMDTKMVTGKGKKIEKEMVKSGVDLKQKKVTPTKFSEILIQMVCSSDRCGDFYLVCGFILHHLATLQVCLRISYFRVFCSKTKPDATEDATFFLFGGGNFCPRYKT